MPFWSELSPAQRELCFDFRSEPVPIKIRSQSKTKILHKPKAWEIRGPLLNEWKRLVVTIINIVNEDSAHNRLFHGITVPPVWELYLVGREARQDSLKPAIVTSHQDIKVAKKASVLLKDLRDGNWKELFQGYELCYAEYPIELVGTPGNSPLDDDGPAKAVVDVVDESLEDDREDEQPGVPSPTVDEPILSDKHNLCGAHIMIRSTPRSMSAADVRQAIWTHATIGGCLLINGTPYALTAAHAFPDINSERSMTSPPATNGEDLPGSAQPTPASDIVKLRHRAVFVHPVDKDIKHSHDVEILTPSDMELPEATELLNQPIAGDHEAEPILCYPETDLALIPVTNTRYSSAQNSVRLDAGQMLKVQSFTNDAPQGQIFVASGVSQPSITEISGVPSAILLPNSKKLSLAWTFKRASLPGDCGSWVISTDGKLFAMVVATSIHTTYCLPLVPIFEKIFKRTELPLDASIDSQGSHSDGSNVVNSRDTHNERPSIFGESNMHGNEENSSDYSASDSESVLSDSGENAHRSDASDPWESTSIRSIPIHTHSRDVGSAQSTSPPRVGDRMHESAEERLYGDIGTENPQSNTRLRRLDRTERSLGLDHDAHDESTRKDTKALAPDLTSGNETYLPGNLVDKDVLHALGYEFREKHSDIVVIGKKLTREEVNDIFTKSRDNLHAAALRSFDASTDNVVSAEPSSENTASLKPEKLSVNNDPENLDSQIPKDNERQQPHGMQDASAALAPSAYGHRSTEARDLDIQNFYLVKRARSPDSVTATSSDSRESTGSQPVAAEPSQPEQVEGVADTILSRASTTDFTFDIREHLARTRNTKDTNVQMEPVLAGMGGSMSRQADRTNKPLTPPPTVPTSTVPPFAMTKSSQAEDGFASQKGTTPIAGPRSSYVRARNSHHLQQYETGPFFDDAMEQTFDKEKTQRRDEANIRSNTPNERSHVHGQIADRLEQQPSADSRKQPDDSKKENGQKPGFETKVARWDIHPDALDHYGVLWRWDENDLFVVVEDYLTPARWSELKAYTRNLINARTSHHLYRDWREPAQNGNGSLQRSGTFDSDFFEPGNEALKLAVARAPSNARPSAYVRNPPDGTKPRNSKPQPAPSPPPSPPEFYSAATTGGYESQPAFRSRPYGFSAPGHPRSHDARPEGINDRNRSTGNASEGVNLIEAACKQLDLECNLIMQNLLWHENLPIAFCDEVLKLRSDMEDRKSRLRSVERSAEGDPRSRGATNSVPNPSVQIEASMMDLQWEQELMQRFWRAGYRRRLFSKLVTAHRQKEDQKQALRTQGKVGSFFKKHVPPIYDENHRGRNDFGEEYFDENKGWVREDRPRSSHRDRPTSPEPWAFRPRA